MVPEPDNARRHDDSEAVSRRKAGDAERDAAGGAVRGIREGLPAKYRVVLILRHLQDMTYEEMAEILTMPIGTTKTHLFRARKLLKERLQSLDRDRFIGTRG